MELVDVHNHSLPGIDDGAKTMSMSLDMIRKAASCGTKHLVLTPHHLNGAFLNHAEQVQHVFDSLCSEAAQLNLPISLYLGSEVHLVEATADELISGAALTYNNLKKAALIELPKQNIPQGSELILGKLIAAGITPVVAHPERNARLRQDSSRLKDWVGFGCKSQLTAQSCTGDFGESIQASALSILEQGLAHVVASDAHRVEGRSPDLQPAYHFINAKYGADCANTLFVTNPMRLIEGEALESLPVLTSSVRTQRSKKKLSFSQKLAKMMR